MAGIDQVQPGSYSGRRRGCGVDQNDHRVAARDVAAHLARRSAQPACRLVSRHSAAAHRTHQLAGHRSPQNRGGVLVRHQRHQRPRDHPTSPRRTNSTTHPRGHPDMRTPAADMADLRAYSWGSGRSGRSSPPTPDRASRSRSDRGRLQPGHHPHPSPLPGRHHHTGRRRRSRAVAGRAARTPHQHTTPKPEPAPLNSIQQQTRLRLTRPRRTTPGDGRPALPSTPHLRLRYRRVRSGAAAMDRLVGA
ncbi:hypothetical protein MSIMFB_03236 [Mycobacterium simulans]|uniref:Uncharacterized protein n=1 Tax=Mycobacterium simulans TaxID=627089 RepID=A0A7Z7NBA7_9MYCO|nr:hypothetical protein MSIMFB_03236 [Mycobacterium simulans]